MADSIKYVDLTGLTEFKDKIVEKLAANSSSSWTVNYATSANKDAAGNVISATYLKSADQVVKSVTTSDQLKLSAAGALSLDLSAYLKSADEFVKSVASGSKISVTNGAIDVDLSGKVDVVAGKGLSTNDLTDALKGNYDAAYTHSQSTHAPSDAEKNTIVTVKVNGTALTPDTDRAVDITVPAATVTDVQVKHREATSYSSILDGTIAKLDLTSYALKTDLSAVLKFKGSCTGDELAAKTGMETGDVWFVTADSTDKQYKKDNEYAWNGEAWVELGGPIDLSGYVQKTQKVNGKALSGDITLVGSDIALTGYEKGTSASIAATDTINAAFGKLEAKADDTASSLSTHAADTDIHTTATEKTAWNAKYNKPADGIPSTDMTSAVQASLGKADSAVQSVVTGDATSGNGTIKVDGTAVSVYGLKSAAYTESTAYATAAQGTKADSAVQPSDLVAYTAAEIDTIFA